MKGLKPFKISTNSWKQNELICYFCTIQEIPKKWQLTWSSSSVFTLPISYNLQMFSLEAMSCWVFCKFTEYRDNKMDKQEMLTLYFENSSVGYIGTIHPHCETSTLLGPPLPPTSVDFRSNNIYHFSVLMEKYYVILHSKHNYPLCLPSNNNNSSIFMVIITIVKQQEFTNTSAMLLTRN